MRRFIFSFSQVLLCFCTLVQAQENLVLNGSFEDYYSCPTATSQLEYAKYCFNPSNGSADYYHSCAPQGFMSVPNNTAGFQYAKTGMAYTGIIVFNKDVPEDREYIEMALSKKLLAGKRYNIEFSVSLPGGHDPAYDFAIGIDKLGVHFSQDTVWENINTPLPNHPQFVNPNGIILDTTNWVTISGNYIAQGDEKFITIGNFSFDSETQKQYLVGGTIMSYYYIDDVIVSCADADGDCDSIPSIPNDLFIPDAFSPNGDGHNDQLFVRGNNIQELYFAVYDRWGEKVWESSDKNTGWDGMYKGKALNSAIFVYYCTGKYTDGTEFKKKGDISLIR